MALVGDGAISGIMADAMSTVLRDAEQAGAAASTPVTCSSLGQKLSSGCPFPSRVGTTCSHSHQPSPAAFQGLNPSTASPGDFVVPGQQLHSHLWLIPDCSLNYSICYTALRFNSFYFCPENNEVLGFLPSSCPLRGHVQIKKSTTSARHDLLPSPGSIPGRMSAAGASSEPFPSPIALPLPHHLPSMSLPGSG